MPFGDNEKPFVHQCQGGYNLKSRHFKFFLKDIHSTSKKQAFLRSFKKSLSARSNAAEQQARGQLRKNLQSSSHLHVRRNARRSLCNGLCPQLLSLFLHCNESACARKRHERSPRAFEKRRAPHARFRKKLLFKIIEESILNQPKRVRGEFLGKLKIRDQLCDRHEIGSCKEKDTPSVARRLTGRR